ncbi:acyl-CoA dehydrogenase [Gordonia sp. CPCC 206044]|uniref:acyl-CoA dehydrogenase n=1 Tax=Gordonia sp. CPCC 206044 TaxID=3140793 RepID=UPI003AF3C7E2
MSIAITDDHRALAEVVARFLESVDARGESRSLLDAPNDSLPSFWGAMADLGWLGVHIREEHGGGGGGLPELAVIIEEMGRVLAPGPFLPTVIASALIDACATDEQCTQLLPGLIGGERVAAVGLGGSLSATESSVSGDAGIVLGAPLADLIVCVSGDDVFVFPSAEAGVVVSDEPNFDPTRRAARVRLECVNRSALVILRGAGSVVLDIARTLVSAEAAGGARACVDMSVEYAKARRQFGRPIGAFGAVKHHCANMFAAAELAAAATWDAARAAGESADQRSMAAAAAVAVAVPAFQQNAQLNVQIHGGIGFTWEHDAHVHIRRAAALGALTSPSTSAENVLALADSGISRRARLELPPEAEQIRMEIRALVADVGAGPDEEQRSRLVDSGLAMPHWPRPWGRGAGPVEQLVIDEEIAKAGLGKVHLGITGWILATLIQHGTPEQVQRWIRPALDGHVIWCQLFSEPDAGSDAAAIRTRAKRVDGGWLVTGQKMWTSGAHEAALGLATIRTDPDAPKHAGITTMVIDLKAPGVDIRPLRDAAGSSLFNEVFFDDVFVPDDDVVGELNRGWTVARSTLGNERVTIGGEGLVATIDPLKAWRSRRIDLDGARTRVGALLAETHTVRSMNVRRAARAVTGGEPGPEGNVTKLLNAELGQRTLDVAMELMGPDAMLASGAALEVGALYMYARQNTIAGGTSEISRNQIGERILGLPRDPLVM